jgi:hypothetical protein
MKSLHKHGSWIVHSSVAIIFLYTACRVLQDTVRGQQSMIDFKQGSLMVPPVLRMPSRAYLRLRTCPPISMLAKKLYPSKTLPTHPTDAIGVTVEIPG